MAGDKFAGITIKWDYANSRCRISMPGYIETLLIKFKHPRPNKRHLSPYKCQPISYGAQSQLTPEADASELLNKHPKRRIQEIVGLLLYYARAVDNKLLVALSAIAARQSYATVATEQAVHLLLDYVATYPADGIVYRSSDMVLCAHADAGFLNETNSRSRAGAHIFLLEDDPFPRFNGAILSIAQIIKFVMASATESELAALFVTAREMIPHRQTLIAMGWPQPKMPIQTDNSTAVGVTNKTIVPRRAKMMDMLFGGFDAAHLKTSFDITGMLVPKTGLIITPNTTQTPTMKPTGQLMLASGTRLASKPTTNFAKPMAHGFPSSGFPFFFLLFSIH
jgi:hypothetical protein